MMRYAPWLVLALLGPVAWSSTAAPVQDPPQDQAQAPAPTEEQVRLFESQIRPVLLDQCVKCHNADKQKGGLRLDSRAAALAGGDSGPAIVPGKVDESLILAAIRYDGEMPKMPPSRKLPAPTIEAFGQWIAAGAPWPGSEDDPAAEAAAPAKPRGPMQVTDKDRAHWAFQPVKRPALPKVANPAWASNPLDLFVLAGLDAKGLKPSPAADRATLIRRVTYDLTGLPPTPEQVAAFVADDRPDAYERLVDRLLDSPAYGEKWGRHWLDLVRYAETNSYERDNPKPSAWRYRDYVVKSLNDDKPYNRFVREQIAGDEMPDRSPETITGTGFYRLGIWDDEPVDREQAVFDTLDDMVATTGQVFLGLTVDCARCHDHKIDPIPQRDYYKLVAFFRGIHHFRNGGPTDEVPYVEPGQEAAYEALQREHAAKIEQLRGEVAAIEQEFLTKSAAAETRPDLEDLRYRFYRDTWDKLPDFETIKFEEAGNLPRGYFDLAPRTRDDAIGFVFDGVLVVPADGPYTFHLDSDDGSRLSIDGKAVITYDGIHGEGQEQTAQVELKKGRLPIRLEYFQRHAGYGLTVSWSGPGFERRPLSARPGSAGGDRKTRGQARELAARIDKEGASVLGTGRLELYRHLRGELNEALRNKPTTGTILCVTEQGPKAPETFVLGRGNPHAPTDKVEPGFLEVITTASPSIPEPPADAKTTGRRTALADWLTDPDHPLVARVMANRLFQHHFGRGIVRSSNNFGIQGDKPTHPELLDWLASELKAQGWRLKPLHRLIVTSSAYRQSSESNPEALAADPINDTLWRFDMRRLTAEEIRDSILAVTGQLNRKMAGPGTYPYIPPEVMAGQSQPGKGWGQSPPEEQARRSIYAHVKRSLLVPILESFDLAETDRSSPQRFSTTQPTQALGMLNGSFLNGQAGLLAERLRREVGDDAEAQVRRALELTTGREPTETEISRGVQLIKDLAADPKLGPDRALQAFCLVILNLNEFLYLS